MKTWTTLGIYVCGIMLMCAISNTAISADKPLLKDNACGACHQDYSTIKPQKHPDVGKGAPCLTCHVPDPAKNEPSKFSAEIHKIHKGGKTTLDCAVCHAI